jgi:hypothetical protein
MLLSWLAGRFRSRAELELEVIALRDQLAILHRQRPGCPQLFALDRLSRAPILYVALRRRACSAVVAGPNLHIPQARSSLFLLEARIVGGDTLRVLKLVKLYPVSFVSRVCEQFCLCIHL